MKRFITILCLALIAAASCAFAACESGETTSYDGDYHYTVNYGNGDLVYGIKVRVYVKGEKVTKVERIDSDYISVTSGWTNEQTYKSGESALLKKYSCKTVEEIQKAVAAIDGQEGSTSNACDEGYLLSGCTQSSARLLKAVQNALSQI